MIEPVLKKDFQLTREDHQTNILIPFTLEEAAERLLIVFSYDPAEAEEAEARDLIQAALKQFVPEKEQKKWGNIDRFLPLKNLITLSLSYESQYVGAHHRKDNHQIVVISHEESDKGFLKQAVEQGAWELQLNAHCIATETVNIHLRIDVER